MNLSEDNRRYTTAIFQRHCGSWRLQPRGLITVALIHLPVPTKPKSSGRPSKAHQTQYPAGYPSASIYHSVENPPNPAICWVSVSIDWPLRRKPTKPCILLGIRLHEPAHPCQSSSPATCQWFSRSPPIDRLENQPTSIPRIACHPRKTASTPKCRKTLTK